MKNIIPAGTPLRWFPGLPSAVKALKRQIREATFLPTTKEARMHSLSRRRAADARFPESA
jgi:hypothetical protein